MTTRFSDCKPTWFSNCHPSWIAGIFSALAGLLILGPLNVVPTRTLWLTNSQLHVDAQAAQIAWNFFRHTKVLQWPLTGLEGYPEGSPFLLQTGAGSPLFGLPLKYLNPVLPNNFQYLGAWIVTCFFLQGYFAARFFANNNVNRTLTVLSSGFVTMSPIFIHRMGIMGQLDMAAHWMILAAMSLYVSNSRTRSWALVTSASLFVGPYIAVMVFAVWTSHLLRSAFQKLANRQQIIKEFLIIVSACVFTATSLGYHTYLNGTAQGPGFFRLNVASFINPAISHGGTVFPPASRILGTFDPISSRPFIAFESEGFNFVGLIPILLFVVALPSLTVLLFQLKHQQIKSIAGMWGPLFALASLLLVFAFSHRIAFVRQELTLPTYGILDTVREVFRSAPRFAWPMTYLILLGSISVIALTWKRSLAIAALTIGLVIHIYDSLPLLTTAHSNFVSSVQRNLLDSEDWREIALQVKSVQLVPTFDYVMDNKTASAEVFYNDLRWFKLIQYASVNRLAINFAYSGRPFGSYADSQNDLNFKNLSDGILAPKTLYVFPTSENWATLQSRLPSVKIIKVILDGFFLAYLEQVDTTND